MYKDQHIQIPHNIADVKKAVTTKIITIGMCIEQCSSNNIVTKGQLSPVVLINPKSWQNSNNFIGLYIGLAHTLVLEPRT